MRDRLGREIEYLRLSITQNCNLKCIYCNPRDAGSSASCSGWLTPDEFGILVGAMAGLGIKKVRITGGEPLTRGDVCNIISRISQIPGIEDLSMTTNGIRLVSMIDSLKEAGLKRLNISLDSLKADRYAYITGGGRLGDVLEGVGRAVEVGLTPVRINVVLLKGVNDGEVDDFIALTRDMPVDVRFIELMPFGNFGEENRDKAVNNTDIIHSHPELVECMVNETGQPARYYRIQGYKGRVGFISPMSHKFCSCCNRIRLTCDGKIRPCLGISGETDLIRVLREEPSKLEDLIYRVIYNKPEGHHFNTEYVSGRGMQAIGG